MHIAYSALRHKNDETSHTQINNHPLIPSDDPRLQGYLEACSKYSREIIAIQQYIPGWVPDPPYFHTEEL